MKAKEHLFEMCKKRGVCFVARFVAVGQGRRVTGEKNGKKYDFMSYRATVLRESDEGTQYPLEVEETTDVGKGSLFLGVKALEDVIIRASLRAGKSADRATVRYHVLEVARLE